ncbi:Flp family type IVb pilin [Devosia sp. J2-20]|jgi:pilus assembly protein Flp/PilA|uniref:Flp family type IVb pilin n=1 Tax=Devosia litorisediminis TaxID=2829817 RepID=A0A942IET9_9HYPH|nr:MULTISPECIES: Flp family type IVb pilin [Devosia]MBS3850059.1 Flp family type IVb pilin [Devosia litorisediminis]WDQ99837.1 Flp family type IVb pilin [Devosia sp. J2-20]|tara:strand:+ start:3923 stop:4114 length:192 start_codon:yes stop_codon:yes gene_type:complete
MLKASITAFIDDESGATAMEYALLAALIGIAIVGTFATLGNGLQGLFNNGAANSISSGANSLN